MALDAIRSGLAILEYELAEERVSALGRLGRQLESALAALAACPAAPAGDPKERAKLAAQAGYALWMFVIQREACGFYSTKQVLRDYNVPKEVYARMGPLPRAQSPNPTPA